MSSPHKPDIASPDDSENHAHLEYTRRLSTIKALLAAYEHRHITIGNLRLVVSVLCAVSAWFAFTRQMVSAWCPHIPIAVFVGLLRFHDHLLNRRAGVEWRAHFYALGLALIEERWQGTGSTGQRF